MFQNVAYRPTVYRNGVIPISSATYRLKSGRAIYLTWQTGYYRSRAVGMQFNLDDQEFNVVMLLGGSFGPLAQGFRRP